MRFPDPNVGYFFRYKCTLADDRISITFLLGLVKIPFKFTEIERMSREVYRGGRISWDVIRWGKCPPGTRALKIALKKGAFREHLIVFDDLDTAIEELKGKGISVD